MLTDTILRNRYKILRELGRGGFSVTYLAVDMDLPGNPKCVVKQLKTRHSNNTILQIAKKLFDREAQVLYRLGKGHKQIPEMFAHFEENDEFYLVQEFVDGHDLTKEIKTRHKLSEDKVIKLLQEILEVLSFVHENNVIHRDIKLRNIMRRREDGKIVLIDFGAVKEIKGLTKNKQGDVNSTLIIGTPGYMPDEQANGKPRLCSDIYAVGMLGIQALTGISPRELPFNPNNGELIWRDSAKVSDRFAEILTGMVRHHFSQRYQTAAEALRALKSPILIAPNTSSAHQAPPVTLPSTVRQSRPVALQTLGLLGLIGVGFGLGIFGWNFFQSTSIGNSPRQTREIPPTSQKINPSVKPENFKLNPPPRFSPYVTRKDGSTDYPILRAFPIGSFLKDVSKTSVIKESSQPQEYSNKIKQQPALKSTPKPIRVKSQPVSEPVIKKEKIKEEKIKEEKQLTFITPQPQKQESLPPIAIPQSEDKKTDGTEKSIIPTAIEVPSSSLDELQKDPNDNYLEPTKPKAESTTEATKKPITEPTTETTTEPKTSLPSELDSVNDQIDQEEDSNKPSSKPSNSDSVDQDNNKPISKPLNSDSVDETTENPTTSQTPDKDRDQDQDKDKDQLSSSQPQQTPASSETPAIESDSPSPKPTPSPIKTSDSNVVIPSAKPLLEDKNFFYTVPTLPTAIPEAKPLPTLSPNPTPTQETEESFATPQTTPILEAEESFATPQTTPILEAEQSVATPTPTPTPETETSVATPTPTPTPTPETEKSVATPTATPIPETEKSVATPTATPIPETEKSVATPEPTSTPETEESVATPELTPTNEAEAQLIPEAEVKPEADAPQPNPQAEFPTIPEIYATPSPETEIRITLPQISASPSGSENLALPQASTTPTPPPTNTPGLSLKRFAI